MAAEETGLTHFCFEVDRIGLGTILFDRQDASVNTLSPEVLEDFRALVERCEQDPAVKAVVVGSAKPGRFIAGGDIDWLATLDGGRDTVRLIRAGQEVLSRLERLHTEFGKPVVAAIDGPCLGGGLEVAMACSYRVATSAPTTRLGQPEVKLGLIPGAGGTQRLPRLVGIEHSIDLIATGRTLRPTHARALGLVDDVCASDELMERARERALRAVGRRTDLSRRRQLWPPSIARLRRVLLEENPAGRAVLFRRAADQIAIQAGGHYPAPAAALRAIRAGIEGGMSEGHAVEAEEFVALLETPQAAALMSIFFATRELNKDPRVAAPGSAQLVSTLGIVGGGLMGAGIATVSILHAGVETIVKEVDADGITRAVTHVKGQIERYVRRRRLDVRDAAGLSNLLTGTTDVNDLAKSDLIIEAVFEDLELKRSILAQIEDTTGPETVFASNTSSIPIAEITARATRPERVVGMHYFSPVERMPLLEVITTRETSTEAVATAVEFGKRQGKTVIVVGDGPGFYTTRILSPYAVEVLHLIRDGALVENIDAAMVAWGFPIGPLALTDEVGIDVAEKISVVMRRAFGERLMAPRGFDALVTAGRIGRKAGRGFYCYEGGKRQEVNQEVYELLGMTRGSGMSPDEIQERLVAVMSAEAVRCLEDGVLRTARDGDIGAVMGLGFPPFRGGPFWAIDREGAAKMEARLQRLVDRHGERFAPPSLLAQHASDGQPFRD